MVSAEMHQQPWQGAQDSHGHKCFCNNKCFPLLKDIGWVGLGLPWCILHNYLLWLLVCLCLPLTVGALYSEFLVGLEQQREVLAHYLSKLGLVKLQCSKFSHSFPKNVQTNMIVFFAIGFSWEVVVAWCDHKIDFRAYMITKLTLGLIWSQNWL